jgi:cation:H+ antiporter
MDILAIIALLAVSVVLMGKGSDWLTDSLIPIARRLGVSGVSVGLIIVSFAVSLPEILVAVFAILRGHPALSLGVGLGSIICNIGLMTGRGALIRPLRVRTNMILRDGVFSLVIPVLVFAVASDGVITRFEGFAFFLLFFSYVLNVFLQERRSTPEQRTREAEEIELELTLVGFEFGKVPVGWISFGLGLLVLLSGTQLFTTQLLSLSNMFPFAELAIGLSIGALGPSLPNVFAAMSATRKGMGEIAVSETLGSNIFTLLVTLGIAAMLSPVIVAPSWLTFELPALLIMSILLFIFLVTHRTVSRIEGAILLSGYLLIVGARLLF